MSTLFNLLLFFLPCIWYENLVPNDSDTLEVRYGVASVKNQRPYQEDRWLFEQYEDGSFICGVFDGHGGSLVSEFVSTHLPTFFQNAEGSSIEERWHNAFQNIDKTIRSHEQLQYATEQGTTACVTYGDPQSKKLYFINTGDSRAICGINSILITATHDHKIRDLYEFLRIRQNGGYIFHGTPYVGPCPFGSGLAVTRSLGDWALKSTRYDETTETTYTVEHNNIIIATPDITSIDLPENGDIVSVMIASDGYWDGMPTDDSDEIHNAVKTFNQKTIEQIACMTNQHVSLYSHNQATTNHDQHLDNSANELINTTPSYVGDNITVVLMNINT